MAIAAPPLPDLKTGNALLAVFRWWHLLSLDAPTVAAVWACFLARIVHLRLPWSAPLMLALGTWLIYVADRLLDGVVPGSPELMRERHYFCASHRRHFLLACMAGSAALYWLIVTQMHAAMRRDDEVVFSAAMIYFAVVHGVSYLSRRRRERIAEDQVCMPTTNTWRFHTKSRLPKEAAVGILFAAGTAVPAWSGLNGRMAGQRWQLMFAACLFAVLCWLNCVAIEHWEALEGFPAPVMRAHSMTMWAGCNLRRLSLTICGTALLLTPLALMLLRPISLAAALLSAAMSAMAFFSLEHFRGSLSPMQLRVAADAALLTPLFFLVAWRLPLLR